LVTNNSPVLSATVLNWKHLSNPYSVSVPTLEKMKWPNKSLMVFNVIQM
jgi:hypothetical protein